METVETLADASLQPPASAKARRRGVSLLSAWHTYVRAPVAVAALVFLLYGVVLAIFAVGGHDPRDMELVGLLSIARGGSASSVIQVDPNYAYPGGEIGYDGQFYAFIALDPAHADAYLDNPAGRMGRIVYPLVARLLAAGQPALIPWTLILVNWLAIVGGTWLAARWLARRGVSPWWALIYGLSSGLCLGLTRDLTEPLAYALAMAGLFVLDGAYGMGSGRLAWKRLLTAGTLFALAGLTRETTLAFPVAVALAWLLPGRIGGQSQDGEERRTRWRQAVALVVLAALPYVAWKLALDVWLGTNGVPENWLPAPYPFAGLIALWPWAANQVSVVVLVALPALAVIPLALAALRRTRGHEGVVWALVLNLLWLVVFLPRDSWVDVGAAARLSDGVVLAAVLCVPLWTQRKRGLLLAIGTVWCLLTPLLLLKLIHIGGV